MPETLGPASRSLRVLSLERSPRYSVGNVLLALTLRIKGDAPRVAWAPVNFPYWIEFTNGQRYAGMTHFLLSEITPCYSLRR